MSPHAGAPFIAHGFYQYHIPISQKWNDSWVLHAYFYFDIADEFFTIK